MKTDRAGAGRARREDGAAIAEEGGARSDGRRRCLGCECRPQSPAARPRSLWVGAWLGAAQARPPRPLAEAPRAASAENPPGARVLDLGQGRQRPAGSPPPPQCRRLSAEGRLLSLENGYVPDLSNPENKTRGPTQGSQECRAGRRLASTCLFTQRFPNCLVSGPLYSLRNY